MVRWHGSTIGFWIDAVVLKLFVLSYFGFCMVPFTLLKYRLWGPVYKDLYWSGLLIFGLFPAYAPILKWVTRLGNRSRSGRGNASDDNGTVADARKSGLQPNGLKTE